MTDHSADEVELELAIAGAFGREPAEWAAPARGDLHEAAFREVGLSEDDARSASAGLSRGIYFSFEDAALAVAAFSSSSSTLLKTERIAEVARRLNGAQLLIERRTPSSVRPRITERATGIVQGAGRLSVCLIDAGQGSSGYYPPAVLEAAGKARVFGAGLHCYLDHPTQTEDYDRPERSVRDLAGQLASDATYRDGGLYAEVSVFESCRAFITERASSIGMSIRAEAEVKQGEAAGVRGPIVERITKAVSCDFVTAAGRGGHIVSWS